MMVGHYRQCRRCRNKKRRDEHRQYKKERNAKARDRYRSDDDYREKIKQAAKAKRRSQPRKLRRIGLLYFVEDVANGAIKIGWTGKEIEERLTELQVGNANQLRLRASLPGHRLHEKMLHEALASHRLRGEWFDPHPDVLAKVDAVRHGCTADLLLHIGPP